MQKAQFKKAGFVLLWAAFITLVVLKASFGTLLLVSFFASVANGISVLQVRQISEMMKLQEQRQENTLEKLLLKLHKGTAYTLLVASVGGAVMVLLGFDPAARAALFIGMVFAPFLLTIQASKLPQSWLQSS